jgi:hypothetical protein
MGGFEYNDIAATENSNSHEDKLKRDMGYDAMQYGRKVPAFQNKQLYVFFDY